MSTQLLSAPISPSASAASSLPSASRVAGALTVIARVVLGLPLLISGANGLFHFFPDPQVVLPHNAEVFMTGLAATGYMFALIAATQFVVGILLIANRFVPLALALLAPFIVNSVAFHTLLEPSGRVPAYALLALELALAWRYRAAFAPMLRSRA